MTIDLENISVGELVATHFGFADTLNQFGIDYFCHGAEQLSEASERAGVNVAEVSRQLLKVASELSPETVSFVALPKDLLIDYILKIHHRGIRENGPVILRLLDVVQEEEKEVYPAIEVVRELFVEALAALEMHLYKEEQVLFPHLYAQIENMAFKRPWGAFHCGSVTSPISVMEEEHDTEGDRFAQIIELTQRFEVRDGASDNYRELMSCLSAFTYALFQHIHLENNILFPWAIEAERTALGY